MSTVVIVGSSRNDGETRTMVNELIQKSGWKMVDLGNSNIGHYDYDHTNREDDFLPLMRHLIDHYDTFIFATPVYWYSMSGVLKVFFDRIADLLTIEKELGRRLRGKSMGVITSSIGNNLGDTFWLPFSETAKYLGMSFLGGLHTIAENGHTDILKQFIKRIDSKESH